MKKCWGIVLLLVCAGCGKSNQGYIPDVPVSITATLSDPRLAALNSYGGAVLLTGGVAGIIIYREPNGGYAAYDRCSSYQPENKCAVTLDSPTLTVTDPCSGSKFSLTDGSPVKAPATRSLKTYTVTVGNNSISVYN